MKGADYAALVRLSDRANNTLAKPGETCDKVPAASLASLLADGAIKPVEKKSSRKAAVEAEKE